MMYLSKLLLDVSSPKTRQCLCNCQDMHRSILHMFNSSRQDAGVLYRFYPEKKALYVMSKSKPDSKLVQDGMKFIGLCCADSVEKDIVNGRCFFFDLLAAPCKKVSSENHKNSQRRLLRKSEERFAWLQRKGIQGGFEIIDSQDLPQPSIYGYHDSEDGGAMHCSSIRFSGILKVVDANKLKRAWSNGIGSGRAYGQGMLLLRRKP